MALPWSRTDRENQCFVQDSQDKVAKRVVGELYNGGNVVSDANPLPTTAVISGDINVDSTSIDIEAYVGKPLGANADFITTRTGNTTFTCGTLPAGVTQINQQDIEIIRQINASGAVLNTYSRDDVTISCSGTDPTTVTVAGATFGTTDTITLYTNITKPKKVVGSEGVPLKTTATGELIVGSESVALKTNANGELITAVASSISGGSKDTVTAGIRVALTATSTPCKTVFIKAKSGNIGTIYVGGDDVDAINGIDLSATDHVELDIDDLAKVYIDSTEDAEGVGFTVLK
jgi:hypothetical protein